jgi:REP element-mobilizing transposase RayT
MVLAYHVILSAYGFWLPNDPRGSWSDFVRAWEIFRFGGPTKVDTRRSVARRPHDAELRRAAKRALKYPPVLFTGEQARAIAWGFADAIAEAGYVIYACAIMPDHVHLVVARHARKIETVTAHLKAKATMRLTAESLHPLAAHPQKNGSFPSPWAARGWSVYLDSVEDILRAIPYVENNPTREGLPRQKWSLVTPYAR